MRYQFFFGRVQNRIRDKTYILYNNVIFAMAFLTNLGLFCITSEFIYIVYSWPPSTSGYRNWAEIKEIESIVTNDNSNESI